MKLSQRCNDCPLRNAPGPVPGQGKGQSVIIIGEAPGKNEIAKGRPFVGRAGEVLRGILRGLDVSPELVRITNIVKCRPPRNREPTRAEIEACLPHLLAEIEACPNARLLLLGNTALHALTDYRRGITTARGEWMTSTVDDRVALPSYHPSYIARTGGHKFFPELVTDMCSILDGRIDPGETEVTILDTPTRVLDYLSGLAPNTVVAWDLETSGYRFYQSYILAMSLSHVEHHGWVITEECMRDAEVHKILHTAFGDPTLRWVGHNAKFDQIFTLQHVGAYPILYADTMMMHLALDERKGTHDLKVLARDLCGATDWESVLWSYLDNREDTYAKVPRDILYKYAAYDADFTLRLYNIFAPQLRDDSVQRIHDELLVPASWAMMLSEYHGTTIDLDDVDYWQCKLEDELAEDLAALGAAVKATVTKEINAFLDVHKVPHVSFWTRTMKIRVGWNKAINRYEVHATHKEALKKLASVLKVDIAALEPLVCWRVKLLDRPFSPGSWQAVGTLVYNVLGLEYLSGRDVRTRGQTYSTSNASLEPHARKHDTIHRILAFRQKTKLKSTYVDGLSPDADFRVHPRWKMHATVTGRIGCTDPNVMNIPHEAGTRGFFIASPEHVLIQADYSQAELRLLAAYSAKYQINRLVTEEGYPPGVAHATALEGFLVKCYREGRDLHTEVTIALFGEDWGYDERMIAKAYNFGLAYGRTAGSIAAAFDMPIEEARAHKRNFFKRMPEVQDFLLSLERAVTDPGELQNAFGRKRRFPYVDNWNIKDQHRQARNFMMQSSASDACLLSTVRISEWFERVGFGRVLVFLHDSVMVEVPEAAMAITVQELYNQLVEVPKAYLGDIVPFKVDVGVGYSWNDLHAYDP